MEIGSIPRHLKQPMGEQGMVVPKGGKTGEGTSPERGLQSLQPPVPWLSWHSDTSRLRRKPQARSQIHPHTNPLPRPWLCPGTGFQEQPTLLQFQRSSYSTFRVLCQKEKCSEPGGSCGTLSYSEEDFRLLPHPRDTHGSGHAAQRGWGCPGPWFGVSSSRNPNSREQENTEIKPTHR